MPLNRQSSDELNSQQGKRKFSLSQYIERKRLKSNELQQNCLTDTDMRINNMVLSKVRKATECLYVYLDLYIDIYMHIESEIR